MTYDVIFRLTNLLTTFGLKWRIYNYYRGPLFAMRPRVSIGSRRVDGPGDITSDVRVNEVYWRRQR